MIERGFRRVPIDPVRVAHFRAGSECARGGCHRTARIRLRTWLLCQPCWEAATEVVDPHRAPQHAFEGAQYGPNVGLDWCTACGEGKASVRHG